jgi:hypothetical protein
VARRQAAPWERAAAAAAAAEGAQAQRIRQPAFGGDVFSRAQEARQRAARRKQQMLAGAEEAFHEAHTFVPAVRDAPPPAGWREARREGVEVDAFWLKHAVQERELGARRQGQTHLFFIDSQRAPGAQLRPQDGVRGDGTGWLGANYSRQ